MKRSPLELAALATAAVPGLSLTAVRPDTDDPADFDAALLYGDDETRWRVRSPKHEEASARLESEFAVLRAFTAGVRAELPFRIPTVAGCVRQGALSTFVYSHVNGQSRGLEALEHGGEATAREVATVLAAVHSLPPAMVDRADLPRYSANEFRQRRLNELDQAATSGKIPAELLVRWEHALEDVTLWRFNATVVHGDLHEDNLLFDDARITAVTGWTDLHIGDPADDFAWLVASHDTDFVQAVLKHYHASRAAAGNLEGQESDTHLLRRAALSAEFALAQYLVKGLAKDDQEIVHEAERMLHDLAEDIRAAEAVDDDQEDLDVADDGEPDGSAPAAQAKVTVTPLSAVPDPGASRDETSDDESSDRLAEDGGAEDSGAASSAVPAGRGGTEHPGQAEAETGKPGPREPESQDEELRDHRSLDHESRDHASQDQAGRAPSHDGSPSGTTSKGTKGTGEDTETTALPVIRHDA